jgi:threonine/homoserine/homoserine lactone efflux protein
MINDTLFSALLMGLLLGAGAGFTPGPLNTLILSESLKHGKSAGIKIAIAPLITDAPIVTCSILLIIELSKVNLLLSFMSMLGGSYIIYLGMKDILTNEINSVPESLKTNSLSKGIIANFLTPHPYIFWITIGSPLVIKYSEQNYLAAIFFIAAFYLLLVGSKIFFATFTEYMGKFIKNKYYVIIIKVLGFLLLLFGIYIFYEGFINLFEI